MTNQIPTNKVEKMRTIVGLSLSGGGAKGLAHIGVLKIINRKKIPVKVVTGASAGAIAGALYAIDPELTLIEEKIHYILKSEVFKSIGFDKFIKTENLSFFKQAIASLKERVLKLKALFSQSVLKNEKLRDLINTIYKEHKFEDSWVKLGIVALDIKTGEEVIITEGKIADAVMASIAIPGIFPMIPAHLLSGGDEENKILIDGASVSHIPVSAAKKLGANFIIASEVSGGFKRDVLPQRGWEMQLRVDEIAKHKLAENELSQANIVILPEVKGIGWADFDKVDICIKEGEKSAELSLANWRKTLIKARIKNWFIPNIKIRK